MFRIKMHISKVKLPFYPPCQVKCELQTWGVNRIPLIDKAWKANVNVWKKHLTLQSVFNHGECMMQADKNVDCHVVDQNVDQISRKIVYVPLGERIRSKRSSYMHVGLRTSWWEDCLRISSRVTTVRDRAPGPFFFMDVGLNPREWVESC